MGPSAGNSHVTTRVMGTYGYAAPEYIATGEHYFRALIPLLDLRSTYEITSVIPAIFKTDSIFWGF